MITIIVGTLVGGFAFHCVVGAVAYVANGLKRK
jgi:hypothetical protein